MKRNIEKMYADYLKFSEKQDPHADFSMLEVLQIFDMAKGDEYKMVAIALGVGVITGRRQAKRELKDR